MANMRYVTGCENCISAPVSCSNSMCGFIQEDTFTSSGLISTESQIMKIIRLRKCSGEMTAVAVGGGGQSGYFKWSRV